MRNLYAIKNLTEYHHNLEDIKGQCSKIIENAVEILSSQRASIFLLDQSGDRLLHCASIGIPEHETENLHIPLQSTILKPVVTEGKDLLVKDFQQEQNPPAANKGIYKTRSFISVPIQSYPDNTQSKIIGAFSVADKSSGKNFTNFDLKILRAIAPQASMVINNIMLYAELMEMFFNIIRTLIKTLEAKDPNTYGHSWRVADYSVALAAEMGLDSQQTMNIEIAGLFHDVGKIGIPENILTKPSILSTEEYTIMKNHSSLGEMILNGFKHFENVAKIVKHHHEYWDGTGYPDRMKGADIPLESRILLVADAYDAMLTDRPYQPGRSEEEVHLELRRCAGTQLDPAVVQVFEKLMNFNSPD